MVAVLAIATGCSGDGSDDAGPTVPTSATPAMTTMTTSATTLPVTTAPNSEAATSAPAPTPAPTTTPPSTTIPIEDQIRAAYEVVFDGYWSCLRTPLDCDTSWLLDGSPSAVAMQTTMQGLADRDRYVGAEDVGYFVIDDVKIEPDGTVALVTACWWSTAVLYGAPIDPDRPIGPDNPATIVNNTPGSYIQVDQLVRTAPAEWLVAQSEVRQQVAMENKCDE